MLSVEKLIRLYVDDSNSKGANIQICPDPDAPEFGVVVMTDHDEQSKQWFGANRLTFTNDDFKVFAKAVYDYSLTV